MRSEVPFSLGIWHKYKELLQTWLVYIESYLISNSELFFPDNTAETAHAFCLGVALSGYLDARVLSFQSTRGSPYYVVYYFKKWPFSFVKCSNSGELGMLEGNGNKSACNCYLFLNI